VRRWKLQLKTFNDNDDNNDCRQKDNLLWPSRVYFLLSKRSSQWFLNKINGLWFFADEKEKKYKIYQWGEIMSVRNLCRQIQFIIMKRQFVVKWLKSFTVMTPLLNLICRLWKAFWFFSYLTLNIIELSCTYLKISFKNKPHENNR
jgi:predicted cupin superfamily sugar epimerase